MLKKYFTQIGDVKASKRFKITERAARSYRLGQRKPLPETAKRIAKLSKGEITLAQIYED